MHMIDVNFNGFLMFVNHCLIQMGIFLHPIQWESGDVDLGQAFDLKIQECDGVVHSVAW